MSCYQERLKRMRQKGRVEELAQRAADLTGEAQGIYARGSAWDFCPMEQTCGRRIEQVIEPRQ